MAGGDTAKAIVEAARSRFERYGYKKTKGTSAAYEPVKYRKTR